MIEITIERSENGIYVASYDGGWNMQVDRDTAISQAKKILKKRGYDEDEFILVDIGELRQ